MISLLSSLVVFASFFNPTVRLNSGKTVSLLGSGPPVVFSPGLFATMPRQIYSEFLNSIKSNVTVVNLDNADSLNKKDISDIADALSVDKVSYVSHSSFNHKILESDRINKAVLIDPICFPQIDFDVLNFNMLNSNKLNRVEINVDFPVKIYRAEKLYNKESPLPEWQIPIINGYDVDSRDVINVGHPDILDDLWAEIALSTKLWKGIQGDVTDFKEWKYSEKNNVKELRNDYRKYLAKEVLDFVNN